jgi:hypothetical protein
VPPRRLALGQIAIATIPLLLVSAVLHQMLAAFRAIYFLVPCFIGGLVLACRRSCAGSTATHPRRGGRAQADLAIEGQYADRAGCACLGPPS